MLRKFDGVTIFEMSTVQLERLLVKYAMSLTIKEVETVKELIFQKTVIKNKDARAKHQADPEFIQKNF